MSEIFMPIEEAAERGVEFSAFHREHQSWIKAYDYSPRGERYLIVWSGEDFYVPAGDKVKVSAAEVKENPLPGYGVPTERIAEVWRNLVGQKDELENIFYREKNQRRKEEIKRALGALSASVDTLGDTLDGGI